MMLMEPLLSSTVMSGHRLQIGPSHCLHGCKSNQSLRAVERLLVAALAAIFPQAQTIHSQKTVSTSLNNHACSEQIGTCMKG